MPCDVKVRIDTTNIVKLDHTLLRQVAEEIAGSSGSVTNQTRDGVVSDCNIAIHTAGLPDGIALQTGGGKRLSFEGNLYQPGYQKVRNTVPNGYVDKVVETSLRNLHFSVTKTETKDGMDYSAVDLVGRQLKILRRPDGKIKFDFGDGFDDAAYHETSDAIKKAMKTLGIEIETEWSQPQQDEKWLEQKIAVIGRDN